MCVGNYANKLQKSKPHLNPDIMTDQLIVFSKVNPPHRDIKRRTAKKLRFENFMR